MLEGCFKVACTSRKCSKFLLQRSVAFSIAWTAQLAIVHLVKYVLGIKWVTYCARGICQALHAPAGKHAWPHSGKILGEAQQNALSQHTLAHHKEGPILPSVHQSSSHHPGDVCLTTFCLSLSRVEVSGRSPHSHILKPGTRLWSLTALVWKSEVRHPTTT